MVSSYDSFVFTACQRNGDSYPSSHVWEGAQFPVQDPNPTHPELDSTKTFIGKQQKFHYALLFCTGPWRLRARHIQLTVQGPLLGHVQIITFRKRIFWQDNVFGGVCLSTMEGVSVRRGPLSRGGFCQGGLC